MNTIRWASFLIFSICVAVAWNGARSWLLAAVMLASILALFGSLGAFRREVWFGTPETDAFRAEIDAELDAAAEHEARREERHRRTTTP
jgi:formate hydrogenlyase subunit 3/multisubunit Na+/H+ antiporter MnhD subunit